ncbi:MAG: calcium-binding protein [Elusimicrobiota bacterium]
MSKGTTSRVRLGKARLEAMIEEATVDAYGESEQATGWFTAIEDNLKLPFETTILGVPVRVEKIDLTVNDEIVAVCRRGTERQAISILELPLPSPNPAGAEWIEAYRRWSE